MAWCSNPSVSCQMHSSYFHKQVSLHIHRLYHSHLFLGCRVILDYKWTRSMWSTLVETLPLSLSHLNRICNIQNWGLDAHCICKFLTVAIKILQLSVKSLGVEVRHYPRNTSPTVQNLVIYHLWFQYSQSMSCPQTDENHNSHVDPNIHSNHSYLLYILCPWRLWIFACRCPSAETQHMCSLHHLDRSLGRREMSRYH